MSSSPRFVSSPLVVLGLCFVVGCAFIAAASVASADSTPRRQYRPTHIGVAPSDMVTLSSSGTGANLKFVQVRPDGTIDSNEYVVPAGYRLVITDVDWSGQQPFTQAAVLRVFAENKATPTTRNVVHLSWAYVMTSSGWGSYAPGGATSGIHSGFSITNAARLTADCANATTPNQAFPGTFNSFFFSGLVVLRGYVVPDA
jgi:hypothetical protein